MNYRKMIEKYVKNELDSELQRQVKQDIEKQEAISEYLFDCEEIGQNQELHENINGMNSEEQDDESVIFMKKINQAIRRAFIKVGIGVGAITIVVVLFMLFALPHIVSSFYYNPGASVEAYEDMGEGSSMNTTTQMSLDMMVYTEMFHPYNARQSVDAVENGYGSYDVSIRSFYHYDESYEEVVGRVDKNQLTLYNPSAFEQAPGNVFGWFQQKPTMETSLRALITEDVYDESTDTYTNTYMAASGPRNQATEALEALQENRNYVAYVTLDKLMKYEDFMKLTEKYEEFYPGWVSVVYTELNGSDMIRSGEYGFNVSANTSSAIYWNEEMYPELWTWTSKSEEEWGSEIELLKDEAYMTTHFTSMLSYLQDQKAFCEMMGVESDGLHQVKEYVEENGIIIQGFAIMGSKEELLRVNDMEEVYAMYVVR